MRSSASYFNTKKVRLKQFRKPRRADESARFQYQKGAIKTRDASNTLELDLEFQYQKGAIKTCDSAANRNPVATFQYQKGAIKTAVTDWFNQAAFPNFNTKKVRLKLPGHHRVVNDQIHFNTKKVRLKL